MNEEIKQRIQHYQPSDEVVALVQATQIMLLCGITGAGKNAIQDQLLKDKGFERIITSTTRAPRENDGVMEQNGREYYFFDVSEAIENIKNQTYFEVAVVHEQINGVTADEVKRHHDANTIAVGNVNYMGIEYFKKYAPLSLAIFLIPPSYEVWMERLQRRYDTPEDFEAAWPARRRSAIKELEWVLSSDVCQVIINDKLDETVRNVKNIIDGSAVDADGKKQAEAILNQLKT